MSYWLLFANAKKQRESFIIHRESRMREFKLYVFEILEFCLDKKEKGTENVFGELQNFTKYDRAGFSYLA